MSNHFFHVKNATTRFLENSKEFFEKEENVIKKQNLSSLRIMVVVYALVVALYLLTVALPQGFALQTRGILIALVVQWVFVAFVHFFFYKKDNLSSAFVSNTCFVFGWLIAALTIYLGTYAFRDEQALLFPMVLILMTQVYTFPPKKILSLVVCEDIVFLTFSYIFKSRYLFFRDFLSTTVALGISLTSFFTLLHFKFQYYQAKAKLQDMCSLDSMTGVMNKSTFTYYFDSFVKSPEATRQYALAVFDLDGFKQINDDYGHQIGDHVLLAFAEFLKNFFGSLDRNTMLGRFGGDEFMLLIKDIDKEYLYLQFASFCKEIPEIIKEKTQLEVTCSVGVSISGGGQQEFQDMFLIADRALYQTKNNKKNSFTIFQSNTNRQA